MICCSCRHTKSSLYFAPKYYPIFDCLTKKRVTIHTMPIWLITASCICLAIMFFMKSILENRLSQPAQAHHLNNLNSDEVLERGIFKALSDGILMLSDSDMRIQMMEYFTVRIFLSCCQSNKFCPHCRRLQHMPYAFTVTRYSR